MLVVIGQFAWYKALAGLLVSRGGSKEKDIRDRLGEKSMAAA